MIRVVGRFGGNMLEGPGMQIHTCGAFLPHGHHHCEDIRAAVSPEGKGLLVKGVSSSGWDDCLARPSLGDNCLATQRERTSAVLDRDSREPFDDSSFNRRAARGAVDTNAGRSIIELRKKASPVGDLLRNSPAKTRSIAWMVQDQGAMPW
ncbi:WD40 repeat-like protein [Apiospora sp. TS-2023a]